MTLKHRIDQLSKQQQTAAGSRGLVIEVDDPNDPSPADAQALARARQLAGPDGALIVLPRNGR